MTGIAKNTASVSSFSRLLLRNHASAIKAAKITIALISYSSPLMRFFTRYRAKSLSKKPIAAEIVTKNTKYASYQLNHTTPSLIRHISQFFTYITVQELYDSLERLVDFI